MKTTEKDYAGELRRNDLDWLRVVGTVSVFFFHCLKMFDPTDWEVKNTYTSEAVMVPVIFFIQWLMPLFFVLSGASIFHALRTRTATEFVGERVRRILLPYATVGLLILVPPQLYVKLASQGGLPDLEIPRLYFAYLKSLTLVEGSYPWIALPQLHLWYLLWLFVFSLLLLPVFLWLLNPAGKRVLAGLAHGFRHPGSILFLGVPAGVLMSLFDPATPAGNFTAFGGWPLLAYPVFVLLGYLVHAECRLERAVERHWPVAMALGVLTWPSVLLMAQAALAGKGLGFGTLGFVALCVARSMNSWFWIVGLLGFAGRHLRTSGRFLRFASEACLPFYMLHQTVIVVVGYAISGWPVAIPVKYVFLAVASFLCTAVSYDLVIRRNPVLRVFFGMKGRAGGARMIGQSAATVAVAALTVLPVPRALAGGTSGFSGRVEPVVAVVRSADHLSTGDSRAVRLGETAKTTGEATPGVFFELRYRLSGAGTEFYGGIPYELGGVHVEAGVEQSFPGKGTLDLNLHAAKDTVWKDPFLEGVDRDATDSCRGTVSLGLSGLLGTGLAVRYAHSRFDVEADEVGRRFPELRRDGVGHSLGLEYALGPWGGISVTPGLRFVRAEAQGRANRSSAPGAALAVSRPEGRFALNLSLSTEWARYDGIHPVFGRRIRHTSYEALGWVSVRRLMGFNRLSATFFAGHERRGANVTFLDARKTFGGGTVSFRF